MQTDATETRTDKDRPAKLPGHACVDRCIDEGRLYVRLVDLRDLERPLTGWHRAHVSESGFVTIEPDGYRLTVAGKVTYTDPLPAWVAPALREDLNESGELDGLKPYRVPAWRERTAEQIAASKA